VAVLVAGVAIAFLLGQESLASAHQLELAGPVTAQAGIGTAFSYQGQLKDGGNPANGTYDFEFKLYSDPIVDSQVGPTVPAGDVTVTNGLFTVLLDFRSDVFNGEARYIAIGVRPGSSTGAYTPLFPRQTIAPVPYAVYAGNALETWNVGIKWQPSGPYAGDGVSEPYPLECDGLPSPGEYGACDFYPIRGFAAFDTAENVHLPPDGHPGVLAMNTENFAFVPAGTQKTVRSAKFYVVDKGGTYPSSIPITLRTYDYAGTLKHTASASGTDLRTTPVGQWTSLTLSPNLQDVTVMPGEVLTFQFEPDGHSESIYTATLRFEARVQ